MTTNQERDVDPNSVVLMVCVKCGREVQLEGAQDPPPDMTCEKCGNQVFRRFDDASRPNEMQSDFRDETERDTNADDAATDTAPGDLLDLNNP